MDIGRFAAVMIRPMTFELKLGSGFILDSLVMESLKEDYRLGLLGKDLQLKALVQIPYKCTFIETEKNGVLCAS